MMNKEAYETTSVTVLYWICTLTHIMTYQTCFLEHFSCAQTNHLKLTIAASEISHRHFAVAPDGADDRVERPVGAQPSESGAQVPAVDCRVAERSLVHVEHHQELFRRYEIIGQLVADHVRIWIDFVDDRGVRVD